MKMGKIILLDYNYTTDYTIKFLLGFLYEQIGLMKITIDNKPVYYKPKFHKELLKAKLSNNTDEILAIVYNTNDYVINFLKNNRHNIGLISKIEQYEGNFHVVRVEKNDRLVNGCKYMINLSHYDSEYLVLYDELNWSTFHES